MNNVILKGRLTKNPEVKTINGSNGSFCVCYFTVAVARKFGNDEVDFIRCKAFGKLAELFEKYFIKGKEILVQGSLNTDSYTNKDGVKVYICEVVVHEFDFCGKKSQIDSEGFTKLEEALESE